MSVGTISPLRKIPVSQVGWLRLTGGEEANEPGKEATKNDSAQLRALVNRQVQAWEKRDFAIAADDWLPNGELFLPKVTWSRRTCRARSLTISRISLI